MARGLWGKIEWIREQPEHIRKRYALLCLAVSMVFILGVWLLSLKSSFRNIGQDIPAAAEKGRELLPDGQVPSLGNLLEQGKSLDAGGQGEKTGQEYFNEQFQTGAQDTGEGVSGKQ